jgi:hypothetical protein
MQLLRPSRPLPEPALDYQLDCVRNGGIYDLGRRGRVDLGSVLVGWSDFRGSNEGSVMARASNVILVHGAWADGSSWSKVIPLLLARGLRVTAVQQPLTPLKDDVATVKVDPWPWKMGRPILSALERNFFLKLCISDAGLARMRSYNGKKITSPNRSFEV